MQLAKGKEESDGNQTWSISLIDEVTGDCNSIYSSEVTYSGNFVKRRKKKNTDRHDKAKMEAMTRNKPPHTNWWAIKKLQVPIPGR